MHIGTCINIGTQEVSPCLYWSVYLIIFVTRGFRIELSSVNWFVAYRNLILNASVCSLPWLVQIAQFAQFHNRILLIRTKHKNALLESFIEFQRHEKILRFAVTELVGQRPWQPVTLKRRVMETSSNRRNRNRRVSCFRAISYYSCRPKLFTGLYAYSITRTSSL